ncbi:MAG: hypothetical protein CMI29_02670 [Opitutae bacterium]|nr:hypothetical protein [Opitutae bacterium]
MTPKGKTPKESPELEQKEDSWTVEFEESFSSVEVGSEPENLFILDGAYAVSEEDDNRRLTLPGSPVGDFGLLFGPRVREKSLELSFSFLGMKKGRRLPALAAGLGGVRSYRFRLNAATKQIILTRQDVEIGKVAYQWESGAWCQVRFQALPGDGENTRIRLKLWKRAEEEPGEWLFDEIDRSAFAGGKCALWGYPYAGTPIHFDDLKIESKAL